MSEQRRGFWYGLAAYTLWGVFPLYFPLLAPATAGEVLAHRIIWSLLTVACLVVLARGWRRLRAVVADRRRLLLLVLAGVIITANWGMFIWAVTHDHVVETSLGYFINPLVLTFFGVVLLGERLRRWQWVGLAVGLAAVIGLSIDYGRPPWIALVLALSFGTYGLLKKRAASGAAEGLAIETVVVAPLALSYLLWLESTGTGTAVTEGLGHALLLVGTGLVTALPLLLFGAAAPRIRLATLGLLQYITPVMQFMIGVAVLNEPMGTGRWIGFGLVWLALLIISVDSLVQQQRVARSTRRARLASEVAVGT